MTDISIGNGISKKQKRIVYITLVSIFLATLFAFFYIIYLLFTSDLQLVILGDGTKELIGLIIISVGAMLGVPLGKNWWGKVYRERKKGLILKVK